MAGGVRRRQCAAQNCRRLTQAVAGFCPEHSGAEVWARMPLAIGKEQAGAEDDEESSPLADYAQRLDEEKLVWLEGRLAAREAGEVTEGVGPELAVARLIVERLLVAGKEVEASRATLVVAKLAQISRQLAGKGDRGLEDILRKVLSGKSEV